MKVHLSLPALDLEATREFYAALFGEPPVKAKADYLKFDPDRVALNISFHLATKLDERPEARHLGFELPDRESLDRIHAELRGRGLVDAQPDSSVCCYARQDKFWVTDPAGFEWELYYKGEDTEHKADPESSCCAPSRGEFLAQLTGQKTGCC